jgi:hypothetical protein
MDAPGARIPEGPFYARSTSAVVLAVSHISRTLSPQMIRALPVLLLTLATAGRAMGQESGAEPPPCDSDSVYHILDFWVGDRDVKVKSELVGTNRISRILKGCAILEEWKDAQGGEGRSLFYYEPSTRRWKQVWVTSLATAPGGTKEKRLVAHLPDGGTRFQGEIPLASGGVLLDRTTLQPLPDGSVRQLIEASRDGGTTWRVMFDASYHRRKH